MTRGEIDDYALDGMARSFGGEALGDMLYELAEDICHGERPLEDVVFGMAGATDDDLMDVAPFDGDFGPSTPLTDRMVTGRKPYACHMTGRPIARGERHRYLVERVDNDLMTYRFSIPALWLCSMGADPTMLRGDGEA